MVGEVVGMSHDRVISFWISSVRASAGAQERRDDRGACPCLEWSESCADVCDHGNREGPSQTHPGLLQRVGARSDDDLARRRWCGGFFFFKQKTAYEITR